MATFPRFCLHAYQGRGVACGSLSRLLLYVCEFSRGTWCFHRHLATDTKGFSQTADCNELSQFLALRDSAVDVELEMRLVVCDASRIRCSGDRTIGIFRRASGFTRDTLVVAVQRRKKGSVVPLNRIRIDKRHSWRRTRCILECIRRRANEHFATEAHEQHIPQRRQLQLPTRPQPQQLKGGRQSCSSKKRKKERRKITPRHPLAEYKKRKMFE